MKVELLIFILTLILLCIWSGTLAFKFFFTPTDELYSHYRNTIDKSPHDFRFRLAVKRGVSLLFFALSLSLLLLIVFSN